MKKASLKLVYPKQMSPFDYGWDSQRNYPKWYLLAKGSDAPFHVSMGDFCLGLKMFPEAEEYVKHQLIEAELKLKEIKEAEEQIEDILYKKCKKDDEWFWRMIAEEVIIQPAKRYYEAIVRRNVFALTKKSRKAVLNIQKAKAYPITDLLEFNRANKAKCIFHEDKDPSLTYYPKTNSVYCWGCNTYADSIKVYRQLKNCSFIEAVKQLS